MRPRYSFSSRKTGRAREGKNLRKQRGKFPDVVNKVLNGSDILLEILDARFVQETRNEEIEKEIKRQKKQILYVINKMDLNAKAGKELKPKVLVSCKNRVGIKELRDKIKEIARKIKKVPSKDPKFDKINVGVIGYPNTGKSSLINLLIGKNSAKTGSEAGFTKGLQKLKLTDKIHLIDSPGVIPKKEYTSVDIEKISAHTKVGARSFSQVRDPETIVAILMKEFPNLLQKYYKIKTESSEHLIEKLGRQKNLLKKGNEVNFDAASRYILQEWQAGKIKI